MEKNGGHLNVLPVTLAVNYRHRCKFSKKDPYIVHTMSQRENKVPNLDTNRAVTFVTFLMEKENIKKRKRV